MILFSQTTRHTKFSRVLIVTLGLLCWGGAATATEVRWQPVSASGTGLTYTIVNHEATEGLPSEIHLNTGGADVVITAEVHINGWGDDPNAYLLAAYGAMLDPAGITSGEGGPIVPLGWPSIPQDGGYIDPSHTHYVFRSIIPPCIPMPAMFFPPPYYQWSGSVLGGCAAEDEGDNNYAGTLLLSVPADAAGTYTVQFMPWPHTFISGLYVGSVQFTRVPLLIIFPRDCNGNGIPDDEEIALGIAEDCNENDVPDECDIDEGTSEDCNNNGRPDECDILTQDCNGNGIPDGCDLAAGTSADCNNNALPDECDVAAGTSQDCNATGVPDECEDDCNENGLADECDLAAGTSSDDNGNGLPDECEIPKNRYVTFASASAGPPVAYQVEMTESALFPNSIGVIGWIGTPDQLHVSRVVDAPHFSDAWPGYVHVGDCEIVPASVYAIRSTVDGVAFGDPVVLATVGTPEMPQRWGDVAGMSTLDGWTPPNGYVNFNDIEGIIRVFERSPKAPPWTWVDVHDAVPNAVVGFADIQLVILAFEGRAYPFTDPAACP